MATARTNNDARWQTTVEVGLTRGEWTALKDALNALQPRPLLASAFSAKVDAALQATPSANALHFVQATCERWAALVCHIKPGVAPHADWCVQTIISTYSPIVHGKREGEDEAN